MTPSVMRGLLPLEDRILPPRTTSPSLEIAPLLPVFTRMLTSEDFTSSFKLAGNCLSCRSLNNVALVFVTSLPYVFAGDHPAVQELDNGLSCRLRYLEVTLISAASLIYNVVFTVVFTVSSLVTFGQVKMIVDQMQKHAIHTVLSVGAIGVSLLGTVSPKLGVSLFAAGMVALAYGALESVQRNLVDNVVRAYQSHHQELKDAVLRGLRGDALSNRQFAPLFHYLDTHLNNRVHTFEELLNLIPDAANHWPRGVSLNTEGISNQFEGLFSHLGVGTTDDSDLE